jgi:hypothetical protein
MALDRYPLRGLHAGLKSTEKIQYKVFTDFIFISTTCLHRAQEYSAQVKATTSFFHPTWEGTT